MLTSTSLLVRGRQGLCLETLAAAHLCRRILLMLAWRVDAGAGAAGFVPDKP